MLKGLFAHGIFTLAFGFLTESLGRIFRDDYKQLFSKPAHFPPFDLPGQLQILCP